MNEKTAAPAINYDQTAQMQQLLPLLLLTKNENTGSSSNSNLLLILLAANPNMMNNDPNAILPLLLLGDGSLDTTALFLVSTLMQNQAQLWVSDYTTQLKLNLKTILIIVNNNDLKQNFSSIL